MTRVAYFANQFADATGHGLARYARELFDALRDAPDCTITPVAGWSSLSDAGLRRLMSESGLTLTGLGRRGTSLLWTFAGLPTLESRIGGNVDVVHAVSLGYPIATRRPLVVTIHDLGPITHPEFFANTRPWVMRKSLSQAVRHAHTIVCVSEATAEEVREVAGPSVEDRVRVVLEGVSPRFFEPADPGALKGLALPPRGTPFILSAGKISPRKNIQGLLKAMSIARERIPHHLVVVGGTGWDDDAVRRTLTESGIGDRVHFLDFVSDEALRALYHAADLYVHPSLYEGFGLPVLEAMASGTPVLASDRSSLPEVVGDAGRLVDATDARRMADDLAEICGSPELRARLSSLGRRRAATFTWDKAAEAMREIYAAAAAA